MWNTLAQCGPFQGGRIMSAEKHLIRFRLDREAHAKVVRLAEKDSRSMAAYVARIVNRWIDLAEEPGGPAKDVDHESARLGA